MEKKMQLYEFAPTRSIRVRWMLQELGVDFESIAVNLMAGEHRHPDFLKINPAGKLPVLVDDDLVRPCHPDFRCRQGNCRNSPDREIIRSAIREIVAIDI
jgi:Glutathione S-transferase, N-terminal domain